MTIYIPPPAALEAVNDTYWGTYNQPFVTTPSQSVLSNDSSANADARLSVETVGSPDGGNLTTWEPNGTFRFVPDRFWFGELLLGCAHWGALF